MPFIIAEPCIGVKDKSCVEVCPVNCIYEGEDQYYIHPDECIDCQACEAACPVQAIFPDNGIPEKWKSYIDKNRVAGEAAMRAYARKTGEDEDRWGVTGLIHDFDWERHPDLERHPVKGVEVLRSLGWPDDVCRAVLGHAAHTGVPR